MVILALHTGPARDCATEDSGEWWDKEWRTGFHKQPQEGPRWLGYQGFRGDEVADARFHGRIIEIGGSVCPVCGTESQRVRRRRRHRLLSMLLEARVTRRQCLKCGWRGLTA